MKAILFSILIITALSVTGLAYAQTTYSHTTEPIEDDFSASGSSPNCDGTTNNWMISGYVEELEDFDNVLFLQYNFPTQIIDSNSNDCVMVNFDDDADSPVYVIIRGAFLSPICGFAPVEYGDNMLVYCEEPISGTKLMTFTVKYDDGNLFTARVVANFD